MAKLSQITASGTNPALGDSVVAVTAGGADRLFTFTQIADTLSLLPPNTQTGTTYTLAIGDIGSIVEMNNASANTVTIPPNSSVAFPVGTQIDIVQIGAGLTSLAAGVGVTLVSGQPSGSVSTTGQWGGMSIYQRVANTWVIIG